MDEQTMVMKVVKVNEKSWQDSKVHIERIDVKKVVDDLSYVFYSKGIPPPTEEKLIELIKVAVDEQNFCSDEIAKFIGMKKI